MGMIDTRTLRKFSPERMHKINLFETPQMFCDIYCLEPGQSQKLHAHSDATKFYFVIEGEGCFHIGDRTSTLSPGGLAYSTPGQPHGVENNGAARLVLLVAMAPNPNMQS